VYNKNHVLTCKTAYFGMETVALFFTISLNNKNMIV